MPHATWSAPTRPTPVSAGPPLHSQHAGDPEMTELVRFFVARLGEHIAAFERAVQDADVAGLAHLAHQLKGSAGGYGFPSITTAAALVERQAKAGADASALTAALTDLLAQCRRATADPPGGCGTSTPEN